MPRVLYLSIIITDFLMIKIELPHTLRDCIEYYLFIINKILQKNIDHRSDLY